MVRKQVIAGNWKMYKDIDEAESYMKELLPLVQDSASKICIAVPFTAIQSASKAVEGSNILVGAQNMNDASEGAFTGEIAGKMLTKSGAKFVILGHSERRHIFGESSQLVRRKIVRALEDGLEPILCVGETLEQREAGEEEKVLEQQINESLEGLTREQVAEITLAYEPVWAIGTGLTAKPEDAEKMHSSCREVFRAGWGDEVADALPILYGGSVNPGNVAELVQESNVDGVLVGGASLTVDSFNQIVKNSNHKE